MKQPGSLVFVASILVAAALAASVAAPVAAQTAAPPAAPAAATETAPAAAPGPARPAWALAIHGGAGVIAKTLDEEVKAAYLGALRGALAYGRDLLAAGRPSLDVVEAVVRRLEDDPLFNAGKGAVYTHDGGHELDAAIMDGRTKAAGAVTGVTTVKNPISLARRVMERSPHVLFAGEGAERFAAEQGVERVEPAYFDTERRYRQWQEALEKERGVAGAAAATSTGSNESKGGGTVGAVALDRDGNLAAATSTGGMTNKRQGRVGDTPIVGAGTYADNATAAISCTGTGELFIRHSVAHDVAARMAYQGSTLQQAADAVIHGILQPGDGGLIAVAHDGSIALVFNSEGMFRGAADAGGRFDVAIWE